MLHLQELGRWGAMGGAEVEICRMERLCRESLSAGELFETLLVKLELVRSYVQAPVNESDEEALELVDVLKGDAADAGDVLVGVVGVVEHL